MSGLFVCFSSFGGLFCFFENERRVRILKWEHAALVSQREEVGNWKPFSGAFTEDPPRAVNSELRNKTGYSLKACHRIKCSEHLLLSEDPRTGNSSSRVP